MTTKQLARAKINLCLHVTGQRADGYHLLDSVVAFADVADVLIFSPADDVTLTIDGPFADGLDTEPDNLILRAAACFCTDQGAAVHLEKNLPVASGIGGGSADAAAALRGLAELWQLPMPDAAVQLRLGADVPVCVASNTVRMQGIGDEISPISDVPDLSIVLINPGVMVSTPGVFEALATKDNAPISCQTQNVLDWLSDQRNDLQAAAIEYVPVIQNCLDVLEETGAQLSRMSGSGATCFGLFETDEAATKAAQKIAEKHPDWWVQTTRLTT